MNAGLKQRVKERQGYHCYVCGGQGDDLHHIIHKSQAPELRDYIDNLVFVCRECHNKIHHTPQLDKKLKREYRKRIEQKFLQEKYYSIREIAEITHLEEDYFTSLSPSFQGADYLTVVVDMSSVLNLKDNSNLKGHDFQPDTSTNLTWNGISVPASSTIGSLSRPDNSGLVFNIEFGSGSIIHNLFFDKQYR